MPGSDPTETPVRVLGEVIRELGAAESIEANLAEWLTDKGLSDRDREALASRGAVRLLAYRQLVHNRIRNVIEDWIPRTVSRLGPDRFKSDVATFIATVGPRAPYLRDVPREFVEWVRPRWRADEALPP